jgi:ribose transport system ATP-binding protein
MILDEATSSLDNRQVARLFELIGRWRQEGRAIIFVSHRMGEILRISTRVTVLRNGKTVASCETDRTSEAELVRLMTATGGTPRAGTAPSSARNGEGAPPVIEISDLRSRLLRGVSLEVGAGELLGIGGLQGQGQADLLRAIFGAIPFTGSIRIGGGSHHFMHPREAMRHGLAFVPGDRTTEGLLMRSSILDNLLLPDWARYGFPLRVGKATARAQETARSLNVVMGGLDDPMTSLSGGNAQKIVIGKWLQREPRLFLLNDPTKGVDVGAKSEFYALLAQLRAKGTSIVFFSSDDEELVGLCDRVLVMYDGTIRRELVGPDLTLPNLVAASLGSSERTA